MKFLLLFSLIFAVSFLTTYDVILLALILGISSLVYKTTIEE